MQLIFISCIFINPKNKKIINSNYPKLYLQIADVNIQSNLTPKS